MKNRTISVIIPTCDRINKLRLAINNVKNQSTKVNEIIIVNNGKKKINKDKLPKLKYLKLYNIKSYVSASKARNFGLKKNKWANIFTSKGQIILGNKERALNCVKGDEKKASIENSKISGGKQALFNFKTGKGDRNKFIGVVVK